MDANARSESETKTKKMINDASTGTITMLEPGKEKEPVTCNEIMAKAVVVASEEKEVYRRKAVAAIDEATRERMRADNLASRIDSALGEARNATIEFEATKLMSERLLEDAKREARREYEALEERMQLEKDEVENIRKSEKEEAQQILLTYKQEAQNELLAVSADYEDKITSIQTDADLDRQTLKQRIEEIKREAHQNMDASLKRSAEKEKEIKTRAQNLINQVQEEAQTQVQNMHAEAKQKIEEAHKKASAVESEARSQAETRIAEIKEEANKHITTIVSNTGEMRDEALNRAEDIERQAREDIENAIHGAKATVQQVRRASELQIQEMEARCNEDLESLDKKRRQEIEKVKGKLANAVKEAEQLQSELEQEIESLNTVVEERELVVGELNMNVASTTRDYEYWKELSAENMDVLTKLRLKEDFSYLVIGLFVFLVAMIMRRWLFSVTCWLFVLPWVLVFRPIRILRRVLLLC